MKDAAVDALVILLVEDNPADVVLFREAATSAGVTASIHVAGDGADAMRFLRRQGKHAGVPRPSVVVLDLNLPIKTGQEVLVEMASDTELNTIPLAILTTSDSEQCLCEMYPRGRCLYFMKTVDFGRFQEIIRAIAGHAKS